MNADMLLQHFDRISEAPDAVTSLRRFILDLAVRGKLVEQDPNDEPATELLKRIQAEATRLAREGLIRKQPEFQQLPTDEQPFDVPANWQWVRFGEIADFSAGRTPSRHDSSFWNNGVYPWVSIADIKHGEIIVGTKEMISEKAKTQVFSSEPPSVGTLIMSFKLSIGKMARLGIPAFHNEAIISIRPHLAELDEYLFKVLPQFSRQGDTKDAIKGATLNRESITNILLPLPPVAEQHRIVAKVDELMALCDQLEAAQNDREARRDRLVAASLHRIDTAPATAGEAEADSEITTPLPEAARFHLTHLPHLTTRPEHIKQLRQTILGLAFQGSLTKRRDEDGLGIDLVNEIYKQWEVDESRKSRAGKSKLNAKFDCKPAFSAPETWGWIQLHLLCEQIGDIDHKMPRAVSAGVPFLSAKDLKDSGELDFSNPKYISEEDFIRLSRKILPRRGDIIYSRIGAKLGKARLVEVDTRFLISYSCCLIRPKYQFIEKRFLQLFLDSHLALRQAHSGIQSIGVPDLGLGEIKAYRIPMPSLAEQHRIVAKVDELMALCDQLEARLTATQTDSRRLLEAVLRDALEEAA